MEVFEGDSGGIVLDGGDDDTEEPVTSGIDSGSAKENAKVAPKKKRAAVRKGTQ